MTGDDTSRIFFMMGLSEMPVNETSLPGNGYDAYNAGMIFRVSGRRAPEGIREEEEELKNEVAGMNVNDCKGTSKDNLPLYAGTKLGSEGKGFSDIEVQLLNKRRGYSTSDIELLKEGLELVLELRITY